jgi:hypothetical protein
MDTSSELGAAAAKCNRRMDACEAAFREGEPLAVAEALTWTTHYRQPAPAWVEEAVVALAMGCRSYAQANRHAGAMVRLRHYISVRDLKVGVLTKYEPSRPDLPWDEVFEMVAERYGCSAGTVKANYARVKRDIKEKRAGKYFMLKDRRYSYNGKRDPLRSPDKPT